MTMKAAFAFLAAVAVTTPALARPALTTVHGSLSAASQAVVDVPVTLVTSGLPLHAAGMDVYFTVGQLRLLSVEDGLDLPAGVHVQWNEVDAGHLRLALLGGGQPLPGGSMAVLRFETLQAGAATLTSTCEGSDVAGATIAMDCETGSIFVAPGAADDGDADGVLSTRDNCPNHANGDQADVDGDGTGDACDPCVHFAPDLGGSGCDFEWGDVAPAQAPNGVIDIGDAVRALRVATGLEALEPGELRRGNVAPATVSTGVGPEVAAPTLEQPERIDVADVVLILRAAVNLTAFPRPN